VQRNGYTGYIVYGERVMKTIAAPTAIAAFQSRPDVQQVLPRLACSSSLRGRKANTRRTRQDDKPQSRETFAMQLQNKHSPRVPPTVAVAVTFDL
jgi:hypothetical protein